MQQEIVIEGSPQEIAQRIAEFPGQILRAIPVVDKRAQANAAAGGEEDAWTRDFRRWAASHATISQPVNDNRSVIYEDRLN